MDAQIHGAIVGGLIGGATLGVTVAGEHWLSRVSARRADVEAKVTELDRVIQRLVQRLAQSPGSNDPTHVGAVDTGVDRIADLLVEHPAPGAVADAASRHHSAEARRIDGLLIDLLPAWWNDEHAVMLDTLARMSRHNLATLVFGSTLQLRPSEK